jgi:transcriptional regulator with XRE-family HTH domain
VALDTAIPPRRLGRALRTARRACGLRRRAAAARLGVQPRLLVAWERGNERVPDDVAGRLVDLYGEHLTALVPARDAVRIETGRIEVGGTIRILASQARDDVLGGYVDLLTALRGAKPGETVPLRHADLEALAYELGRDVDDIEARIVELLRCTREEAAIVHAELRRRMLVPVAGVAVGVAAWAGAIVATQHPAPASAPQRSIEQAQPVATDTPITPTTATASAATTSTVPAPSTTASTAAPAPSPTTPPPSTAAPAPTAPPAPSPPSNTAPAPAPTPTAPAEPTPMTTQAPPPDVSIPGGETPTIVSP